MMPCSNQPEPPSQNRAQHYRFRTINFFHEDCGPQQRQKPHNDSVKIGFPRDQESLLKF